MREYLSDKQVKSELTALLQVVHEFLVEHNIKYTITAGTLLGAVRHNGFISYQNLKNIMQIQRRLFWQGNMFCVNLQ